MPTTLTGTMLTVTISHPSGPRTALMTPSPESDLFQVWARRLRASDPDALEALFRALHAELVRFAEGLLKDGAAARDITQDAFIRIWDGRERLDPSQSLKAFAYRTVRNLCLNRIRDRKNRASLLEEHYEPPGGDVVLPDRLADGSALAERLQLWIEELPDRQREALTLSRFHGMSHEEVAEAMDVSPRTVNNHLVKALRSIRNRVREYEPDLLES